MTVQQFEQIQREYHALNERAEAGESTLREFLGIWQSFLRVSGVHTIQEVNEKIAVDYVRRLTGMSKTQNRRCKTKVAQKLAVTTIRKHVRHLAAAWNRIREDHHARVGGLASHEMVKTNPWEAIRHNVPRTPADDDDPVQFELGNNDLGRFLDQFSDRPVGELFIITSLWCWGRIKEMARMEWSWIEDDYVVIPRSKAKKGRGKVARIPPAIRERLEAIRDPASPYVFANWVEDVRRFSKHPKRIQGFDPARMVNQVEKLIPSMAEAIGRPEISHHALRRTAMELGEEAELRMAEKTSAEKLQTTVGNKRRNYTKRLGKKAYTLANGIYENLTVALHDHPSLAKRLGCEPLEMLAEREAEAQAKKLTPLQRQRLAKKLLEGEAGGEGHGVA
jgi:integrase